MAYNIYKSDGTPISVADNAIDSQFYSPNANGPGIGIGTRMVGRNAIDYGAPTAQNFLQLTENFCSPMSPPDLTAMQGQLWFKKLSAVDGELYVRTTANGTLGGEANWQKVLLASSSGSGSTISGNLTVDNNLDVGVDLDVGNNLNVGNDLDVTGTITAGTVNTDVLNVDTINTTALTIRGGDVVVVNPTPGSQTPGDIQIAPGPIISIYAEGAWRQIFPAVYS